MAALLPFEIDRADQVATISMIDPRSLDEGDTLKDIHYELGVALEELRWDESIRVIVLTGKTPGYFQSVPPRGNYRGDQMRDRLLAYQASWNRSSGLVRTHQALALIEKPIVAKVNGDVSTFGQSVLFGCDIIVAWEDARITDAHLAMADTPGRDGELMGTPFGLLPGDGALVWLPGLMTTTKAKEYLMLAEVYTAKQLAEMNVVNHAVPMEQLDEVTDRIVQRLLARPAHVLAFTKRAMNKHVVNQMNLVLDLGDAYERLNIQTLAHNDFQDQFTLGDER